MLKWRTRNDDPQVPMNPFKNPRPVDFVIFVGLAVNVAVVILILVVFVF